MCTPIMEVHGINLGDVEILRPEVVRDASAGVKALLLLNESEWQEEFALEGLYELSCSSAVAFCVAPNWDAPRGYMMLAVEADGETLAVLSAGACSVQEVLTGFHRAAMRTVDALGLRRVRMLGRPAWKTLLAPFGFQLVKVEMLWEGKDVL